MDMPSNTPPNQQITPRSSGFFQDLADRFRLVSRLVLDQRVNPVLKVLPFVTLVYVISPIDLLSVNPIDDAFVVWLGTTLFVELCPQNVVDEHLKTLRRFVSGKGSQAQAVDEDVVDGVFYEAGKPGGQSNTNYR
jgi:uncharacterized membrane protein YkvA (DUF1232 family)